MNLEIDDRSKKKFELGNDYNRNKKIPVSFFHWTIGLGYPEAEHWIVDEPPRDNLISWGLEIQLGDPIDWEWDQLISHEMDCSLFYLELKVELYKNHNQTYWTFYKYNFPNDLMKLNQLSK